MPSVLGMFRKQGARGVDESIPEDLIATIPVVGAHAESTVFVPVHDDAEGGDVAVQARGRGRASAEDDGAPAYAASGGIAAQLRFDMGEAFARELDRAEQAVAAAVGDLEQQVARLFEQVNALQAENDDLRKARDRAERKLKAFQELALEKS